MSRIIDGCPAWLSRDIQQMLAEKIMQGFGTNHRDEMRRVAEALEWLSTTVEIRDRPKLVPEQWQKASSQ